MIFVREAMKSLFALQCVYVGLLTPSISSGVAERHSKNIPVQSFIMYPKVVRDRLFDTDLFMGCFSLRTCVGSIGFNCAAEAFRNVAGFFGSRKICPVTDNWVTFPVQKSLVVLICFGFYMGPMPTSEAQAW